MIPIMPLLFAAPKYLAGDLSLGQVTQLAAAFIQVQIAISWVVDNYNRIAEWYASARRVMDIVSASEAIDPVVVAAGAQTQRHGSSLRSTASRCRTAKAGDCSASAISRSSPVRPCISPATLAPANRRWCAFSRASSSLTVASLRCPMVRASGPATAAYIPLGTIRTVLQYASPNQSIGDAALRDALDQAGLAALASRLDETRDGISCSRPASASVSASHGCSYTSPM